MLRKSAMLMAAVLALVANAVAGNEKGKPSALADAVLDFNQRSQKDAIGKDQPALTVEEVVAAIRGWDRKQVPATDEVYKVCQTIADAGQLQEGATLGFTTRWSGFNNYEFDVWWIDLEIKTEADTGNRTYRFRIRDRMLRCRPLAP